MPKPRKHYTNEFKIKTDIREVLNKSDCSIGDLLRLEVFRQNSGWEKIIEQDINPQKFNDILAILRSSDSNIESKIYKEFTEAGQ